jgi:hypothetical protein
MIKDIGVKSLEEQLWVKGYELEDDLRTRGASPAFRQGALALLRQIELLVFCARFRAFARFIFIIPKTNTQFLTAKLLAR